MVSQINMKLIIFRKIKLMYYIYTFVEIIENFLFQNFLLFSEFLVSKKMLIILENSYPKN